MQPLFDFEYDANGLIVQKDGDGGDTAGREGDYWFAQSLYSNGPNGLDPVVRSEFDRVIKLLQPSPGIFIRNPTRNPVISPAKSWNDPSDFSRDQTIPMILSLGQMSKLDVLGDLLKAQLKRFGLFQNKDLPDPQTAGAYIRGFYAWYLYPLLFVTDLGLVVESIVRCLTSDPDDVSDDINHTLLLLQSQYTLDTPIAFIARKIYVIFRHSGVQGVWDRYFRPETGANPFNDMYRNLISKL